jgi:hypothetical protein
VANAVSAGATALEAAAVVTPLSTVEDPGVAAVRELGPTAPVYAASPDGALMDTR